MPSRDDAWKAQYKKLVEFKEKEGHCKVTRAYDDALYVWCYTQRKKRRDNSSALSTEQIAMLSDVGFSWETQTTPARGKQSKEDATPKKKATSKSAEAKKVVKAKAKKEPESKKPSNKAKKPTSKAAEEKAPEVKPNETFLQKSYNNAVWLAKAPIEALRYFVSF